MKKLSAGQVITVLANVGVITSIVFLALELNQNNAFLRSDAQYRVMQNRQEFPTELIRDPSLTIAHHKSLSGQEISDVERTRLYWLYSRMWSSVAWEYQQYRAGLVPNWPMEQHRTVINWNEIAAQSYMEAVDGYRDWAPEFYEFIMENSLLPD